MLRFCPTFLLLLIFSFIFSAPIHADDYKAKKAAVAPVINGLADDACWADAAWFPLNQIWVPAKGTPGTPQDFTGDYKAVWTADKIYILLRVTDDTLINWHPTEPLNNYWNNDCPEIFIDEDHSKGEHECNYNAFALHVSTLFQAIDEDPSCTAQLFNDVFTVQRTRSGNTYFWEFAMNVYTDKYQLNAANNPKASLVEGKIMGFSIAYNDSDQDQVREKMYGSQVINLADPNVSYKTADYFGTMELVGGVTGTSNSEVSEGPFTIFPNPASDLLNIYFGRSDFSRLRLLSPEGREVLSTNVNGTATCKLNVGMLSSGVYFLYLEGNTGVSVEKILIR